MKKTARIAAVVSIAALVLAGCGERSDDSDGGDNGDPNSANSSGPDLEKESHPDFKACIVSDSGGFEDKSFNETSYKGIELAKEYLGVKTAEVESNAESEFVDNINEMVNQDCNSITTVGFLLGDATLAAAKKNKNVDFSIVDFAYADPKTGKNTAPANVKGLTFNTSEPSYLAGYLAAATTESGTVGTYGGVNIPTVTIFMDGFVRGVERFNKDNGESVKVIGWDPKTKKGSFTNDFESKSKGKSTAEGMITQGADIIFPVAGPAGLGGLQAAQDADAKAIWVDSDGCESTEYCDVLLGSVVKGMDVAVEAAIRESANDEFTNEPYSGTLENDGVSFVQGDEADIESELEGKLEELKQEIIDDPSIVTK